MKSNYLNYILDQLQDIEGITIQKQLGGVRFFRNNQVFGAISGGRFRLRRSPCEEKTSTDEGNPTATKNLIETKGLDPSRWCTVPEAVISDTTLFPKIIRYVSGEDVEAFPGGRMTICG
jgi:hypothetical protein